MLLLCTASLHGIDQVAELAKQASVALATKDFAAAERGYRAILAIDPRLAEMRSNLGIALHMQGKYDQSELEFRQAARVNPRLFVPNYFLGVRLFKTNRYEEARSFLAAALSIDPGNLQAREWLAATHIGLHEHDEGMRQYRQILKQEPTYVDALYAVGKVYVDLMDRSLKIVASGPENAYYGLLLLEAVGRGEDWRKLIDTKLPTILRANPLIPALRYKLGILKLRSGQTEEARHLFQEEIAIDPWSFQAYYGLAQISLASAQFETFADELNKAVATRPEYFCPAPPIQLRIPGTNLEAALERSRDPLAAQFLAAKLGRTNSFCAQVARFVHQTATNDGSSGKSAEALFREKRYEAAISLWTGQSKPTHSSQLLLAQAYLEVEKFEEAATVANSLILISEFHNLAYYLLCKSYEGLALQTLTELGRIAPESYRTNQLMGEAYFARQNLQEAIHEFKTAITRKPEDAELHYQLGRAYYSSTEFSAALSAFEKSLELDPSNAGANFLSGKIFLSVHEPAKALASFETALRLDPSMVTARAELGKTYLRMNRWQFAARELELASSADTGGELYYELFRAYSALNQREKAQQALAESKKRREQKLERERARLASASLP
jgi:tetratricopeptide (TPR) repeat protein